MFSCEIDITEEGIQQPYAHVHHADAVRYLEHARLKFLKHLGVPNEMLFAEGYALVVVRLDVRYRQELVAGKAFVTVESSEIQGKFITLKQSILTAENQIAVEASVVCAGISPLTRRAITPPINVASVLGKS